MIAVWEVDFGNVTSVNVVAKNVDEAIKKARKSGVNEDLTVVKKLLEAEE